MAKRSYLGKFKLLPPEPGTCIECAVKHHESDPHNQQSLYYQYKFYDEHGRWPTWKDAMSHCSEETQKKWVTELEKRGVKVE